MTPEQHAKCMQKGLCFGCGKQGHLGKDCPDPKDYPRFPWLNRHNPEINWQTRELNWRTTRKLLRN